MRCPKCHYISFESAERCRNCGYEFSLTVDVQPLDLPIQTGTEAHGPLGDLSLTDGDQREMPSAESWAPASRADRSVGSQVAAEPRAPSLDLPLFMDRTLADDRPLVDAPAVPRIPLAVRRSTPTVPRPAPRAAIDEPVLDLEAPEASSVRPAPVFAHATARPVAPAREPAGTSAGPGPRLLAAVVDAVILGSIGGLVIYFTLKVCGLRPDELRLLPPVPFVAFLVLVIGGYFVIFIAAGGQTIGKMIAGIKVVPVQDSDVWRERVPVGQATLRAAGYLVSILPAGLGFLPALVGAERRAVHDRLADTRVVKV